MSRLCHNLRARQAEHATDDITTLKSPGQVIALIIWTPEVLTIIYSRKLKGLTSWISKGTSLDTCVLTVGLGVVEDLVLPHVEVEKHDEEDDPVVEPFPWNMKKC